MFDGRNYTDGIPVRKHLYAPDSPHVGEVLGRNLRNAYFVSRASARGLQVFTWPLNLTSPFNTFFDPTEIIQGGAFRPFHRSRFHARAHITHVSAQIVFTVNNIGVDFVTFRMSAGSEASPVLDRRSVEVELAPGYATRLPEGAVHEGPGGSYEALIEVPLNNTPKDATVVLTLEGSVQTNGGIRVDSLSLWRSSVG